MTQLLDIIAKPVRRDVIINGGVVSRFVPSVLCGPPGAFSAPLARHLAFASAANGKRTLLLTDDGNAVAEWSTWAEVTKAPAWARSLLTVVHEAQTNDWCRSHRGFGRMAAIRELTPKLAPQIVVSDFLGTAPLGLFAHEASTYLEIASRFMEDDGAGVLLAAHTARRRTPRSTPHSEHIGRSPRGKISRSPSKDRRAKRST